MTDTLGYTTWTDLIQDLHSASDALTAAVQRAAAVKYRCNADEAASLAAAIVDVHRLARHLDRTVGVLEFEHAIDALDEACCILTDDLTETLYPGTESMRALAARIDHAAAVLRRLQARADAAARAEIACSDDA